MRVFSLALLAASGTALVTASALPASAQLARPQTVIGVTGGNDLVTEVQWRGGGYRGGYRGRYYGPGIGLGIGLATGALIGGALAAPYFGNSYYYSNEPGYAPAYSYGYAPGPTRYYRGDPSSYYAPYYDGGAYNRERALTGSDW